MQRLLSLVVAIGTFLIATTIIALYLYQRPTILSVAVARGSDSQRLLAIMNQEFSRARTDLRFRLVPVSDSRAAAKAMEEHSVDLAVIRSDLRQPPNALTALILEHQLLVIATAPDSKISGIADLKGKHIVLVSPEGTAGESDAILYMIEEQYALPPNTFARNAIDIGDFESLVARGDVDAVVAFGRFDSPQLSHVIHTLTRNGAPSFLAIGDAAAMAKKNQGLESTSLLRGAFGGGPSIPGEDVGTIGVTLRLVADSDLANSVVGELVRQVLAQRTAVAAKISVANHIETPDTDKGEALPTHPGAAAFIDDEEKSFFDKYSDMIYVGTMIGSILISVGATLLSRITVRGYEQFDQLIERALQILKDAREAPNLESLQNLELQIDEILTRTLATGRMPKLDVHQLAGLTLAVEQARLALMDRRRALSGGTTHA
jgi:TRAP-type uncharacterized transport system substrate-binding protein